MNSKNPKTNNKSKDFQRFPRGKSRSLAKICQGSDDIIGLIAYGLFKMEQSEWAEASTPEEVEVNAHHETLQNTRIESLRSTANNQLSNWLSDVEERWYLENYEAIKSDVADAVSSETRNEIEKLLVPKIDAIANKGGFLQAITANLIAWILTIIITLALTFLVVWPEVLKMISNSAS